MTTAAPRAVIKARRVAGGLLVLAALVTVLGLVSTGWWLATRIAVVVPVQPLPPTATGEDSAFPPSPNPQPGEPVEPVVVQQLRPVLATATAERDSVFLRCTGAFVPYGAENLIDGDVDTGWGASAGDGSGQSVTVTFDEPVHLTRVGLTPGFTKTGPRKDRGCAETFAFPLNRFVRAVRYSFDDGQTVRHDFEQRPGLQFLSVDTTTREVRITILETYRPPGADNDTILSEAQFEGSRT